MNVITLTAAHSLHDLDVGEARGAAQPTDALYRCPPRLRWLAREDFTGATQWPSPFPSCPTHHRLRLHIELCLARARPSDAGRVRSSPRRACPLHRRTASKQSNPRSDSRSHQRMALGTARYYSEHIIQRHLPPQSRPTASPSAREASLRAHITWYDRRRADLVASWHMPRGCSGSTPWPRAVMARIAERWLCHHHLHLLHQPLRLLLGLGAAVSR